MERTITLPFRAVDERIEGFSEQWIRRVAATPPGMCPLAHQLTLLEAGSAQTCGKCVPCRDGLPQLARMLRQIVECGADRALFDRARSLARMIEATSDCAIGYEAARAFLEGCEAFADEYESHLTAGRCTESIAQKVPCEAYCPAHVDVPAYLALTAQGRYADAVNMVRKDNPFPTACALVCEHPCEIRCRRTLIDAPINIRGIKLYACDQAPADTVPVPPRPAPTNRRIAVVGAGPSGLTCAYFCALMGHEVTVFEARSQAGGMLRYGIPAYRFPRERLAEDIGGILAVGGIDIRFGERIDAARFAELRSEYDAVYLAIGAQAGKRLRIEGADAAGVISAVDMLGRIGDGEYPDFTGKRVLVIGGGNVAMDCARTAIRLNPASVDVVYRRRKEDMTALAAEVEAAIAEGVGMVTLAAPERIEVDSEGACTALIVRPQMIGPVKRGRPAPVDADKPLERLEADVILIAVGQDIESAPFAEAGLATSWGQIDADEGLAVPGFPGVFAGGDCQGGPTTVIKAVGAGKVAARNIDAYLGFAHKLDPGVSAPAPLPNNRVATGRVEVAERPARERRGDFAPVELGMSHEEMLQECGRCLRCDHYGSGVLVGGRERYA